MNLEIYHCVRSVRSSIGRYPCDMGYTMMFIHRGEANFAYPHLTGPYRSIVRISLDHDLFELIVIFPVITSAGEAAMKSDAYSDAIAVIFASSLRA